jgi:hypothetical protein
MKCDSEEENGTQSPFRAVLIFAAGDGFGVVI